MDIKTKFDVEEKVWVIKELVAVQCTVTSLDVKQSKETKSVMYTARTIIGDDIVCAYEKEVFSSKEELISKVKGDI